MANWLVKGDPEDYSAGDLERDGKTDWTGVRNPVAQRHLRAMTPGDRVLVYHAGAEKAVVAIAKVASKPTADGDPAGKLVSVELAFVNWVATPVALAAIKADPFFKTFDLVRIGRLSVMPVSDEQWTRLLKMADGERRKRA